MRYYLIAGEASGDLHGSNLIKGLVSEDSEAQLRFWGGDLMKKAAGDKGTLVHHYKEGAVMGFTEVLSKAGKLLNNIKDCKLDIYTWSPDVVILIDYPGFNLKIAEFCHKKAIKVFYYIAPKTWASRPGRNKQLKKYIDSLFIVFPFEIAYFQKQNIPYIYKGNPLIDAVDNHNYTRPIDKKYIAILAGSRKAEISRMMPVCMDIVDRPEFKDYQFVVAGAPSRTKDDYEKYITDNQRVSLIFDSTYDILKYADAAIINSGTASLEAALIGTPQVVAWSSSPLTFFIATKILKVLKTLTYISLGNLCVGKFAFQELLQNDFNPETLSAEVHKLLSDNAYRNQMLDDYAAIRTTLGDKGASQKVAKAMINQLK